MAGLVQGAHQEPRSLQSRRLFPRAEPTEGICGASSSRVSGIFFGDFTTGGGYYSKIPLAIQGNINAPGYIVNTGQTVYCSNPNSISAYGLIVGGTLQQSSNMTVYGTALVAGGGDLELIHEESPGCIVSSTLGTGEIDFNQLKNDRISANQAFAEMPPTLVVNQDNTVTRVRAPINGEYEVFQFSTCHENACDNIFPNQMSYAKDILQNPRYFDGFKGFTPDPDMVYVFNMPVRDGDFLVVDTSIPARGIDPCKVIYNPYPVDSNNALKSDGSFQFLRDTNDVMGGYTLAPLGDIVDAYVGGFGGDVVGKSYRWDMNDQGAEFLDYSDAGGNCDVFKACNKDITISGSATQDSTDSTLPGTFTDRSYRAVNTGTDSTLSGTLTNQTPSKNSEFSTVTDDPSSSSPGSGEAQSSCSITETIIGSAKAKTVTGHAKTVTVVLTDGPSTFTVSHKVVTVVPSTATISSTKLSTIITTRIISSDSTVTIDVTET
ncbi:hypothetical protein BDF21DRAFT_491986 [Thamnidium elegans]|uniref:Choice-of-anchor A domain-containing protein n=1 Tax=Thamnidium elegans TaxID=101142 RepID=A0A8H7SV65_9FUNG|nr:hypothetical protein INT48_008973 [Thamnidium elegans]KAI8087558.1 hypothetical protein BDF21DRAFT_491986 [Thamnidium elegans]